MTTEEKVQKIHQEFHTSFQEAEDQLLKIIDILQEKVGSFKKSDDQDIYQNLNNVFPNSKSIKSRNQDISVVKNFNRDLDDYLLFKKEVILLKEKYPYKLISYAQIDEILRKWDLYVGPTTKYVEQIPPTNAKEIVDYLKFSTPISETSIERPICSFNFTKGHFQGSGRNLYICAPLSHFEKQDLNTLEREVYYRESPVFKMIPATKVMDPIVLAPLVFQSNIGKNLKMFHVITAWGPESEDSYVKEGGF